MIQGDILLPKIIGHQRRMYKAQDEVRDPYIFSQLILFLRLCDPTSLEDVISWSW